MTLNKLLEQLIKAKGSDLFLSVSAPACIKVEGKLTPLNQEKLNSQQVHDLLFPHLSSEQVKTFEQSNELNIALRLEDIGRFRLNAFRQMGEVAVVIRHISGVIPSFEELALPELFKDIVLLQRGLVLLVGGTGTGKSTTLAAMIDYRNSETHSHILTIEDPVEFVHQHKKSLVNQREVGVDTASFEVALMNAMREAPDVILIGEIRDQETMRSAITYAETGHLCLASLHANNSSQAFDRILGFFPVDDHQALRHDLSRNLKSIISQRLPTGINGKRVAAFEILTDTSYIKDCISKGKIEEISQILSQQDEGCQSFENSLYDLTEAGKITQAEALNYADSKNNLDLRFRLEGKKEAQKIHKKVAFDELAHFSDYSSYSLKQVRVPEDVKDRMPMLEEAFRAALMSKGLIETPDNPDLEVQYIFVTKERDVDKLGDVENAVSADINLQQKTKRHALLRINLVDTRNQKAVWQVTASREMAEQQRTQSELDKDADFLFDQFPPFAELK